MAKIATLTLVGKSGTKYDFNVYEIGTDFKSVIAVYVFTERYKDGDSYTHKVVYIGYTTDTADRFDNHHKDACIKKNKANCICIHQFDTEKQAKAIELDLLANYNTPCNEVNN